MDITVEPAPSISNHDIITIPCSGTHPLEEVLIMGAGTSTCIPLVACLTKSNPTCLTCLDAVGRIQRSAEFTKSNGGPPFGSKQNRNFRTNPSALLRYRHSDGTLHNILIDCGKTFYQNSLNTIVKSGAVKLDGVVLTHGHADAILGLDDLRHWAGHCPTIQKHVDVHCEHDTYSVVKDTFPYLVNPQRATGGGEVSVLKFHTFHYGDTFTVGELVIKSIKVKHGSYSDGRDYFCNGFKIGSFTYLSDLSGISPESLESIKSTPTEVLLVDCLFEAKSYPSHFGWPQTSALIKQLSPNASILVGMAHSIDYYAFQRKVDHELGIEHPKDGVISKLVHQHGRIYVGFDGLVLKFSAINDHEFGGLFLA